MAINTTSAQSNTFALLDPDSLALWINHLVTAYQRSQSSSLAWAIMRCTQALSQHPDYEGSDEDRCLYGRLARQWGWLLQSRRQPETLASMPTGEVS